MKNTERVQHEGIVKDITADTVEVLIVSRSACSSCHARNVCGSSDEKEKTITVYRPQGEFKPGDRVNVFATMNQAFYSVLLSYVIPSVLILAVLFLLQQAGSSELAAAVCSLALLAAYFFILYLFRNRISRRVTFTIEKIGNY